MDMTLYRALQGLGNRNSHTKCVQFHTDWALNGFDGDWDEIGDAADALGNLKLAMYTDFVEACDEWDAKERIALDAADALNVR